MRHLLLATATCLALIAAPAVTASAADAPAHAATAGKPVNKIDPLSGKDVDATVDTLELSYTHKDKKKAVVVGFSSKDDLAEAKKDDEKTQALIAEAADHHKLIKDGKLVEIKHEKKDK